VTPDQFAELTDEEKDFVKPGPDINRAALEEIIRNGDDGEEAWDYLTPRFVDDFWIDAAVEHRYFSDCEAAAKVARRKQLMKEATVRALRAILGMDEADEKKPDDENKSTLFTSGGGNANEVQLKQTPASELLASTVLSLRDLMAIGQRMDKIEGELDRMGTLACQLDTLAMKQAVAASPPPPGRAAAGSKDDADKDKPQYRKFLRLPKSAPPPV
jgi:hypothetical protein